MVQEAGREYESQWAAIMSIAAKIGGTSETLRRWVPFKVVHRRSKFFEIRSRKSSQLLAVDSVIDDTPTVGGAPLSRRLLFSISQRLKEVPPHLQHFFMRSGSSEQDEACRVRRIPGPMLQLYILPSHALRYRLPVRTSGRY